MHALKNNLFWNMLVTESFLHKKYRKWIRFGAGMLTPGNLGENVFFPSSHLYVWLADMVVLLKRILVLSALLVQNVALHQTIIPTAASFWDVTCYAFQRQKIILFRTKITFSRLKSAHLIKANVGFYSLEFMVRFTCGKSHWERLLHWAIYICEFTNGHNVQPQKECSSHQTAVLCLEFESSLHFAHCTVALHSSSMLEIFWFDMWNSEILWWCSSDFVSFVSFSFTQPLDFDNRMSVRIEDKWLARKLVKPLSFTLVNKGASVDRPQTVLLDPRSLVHCFPLWLEQLPSLVLWETGFLWTFVPVCFVQIGSMVFNVVSRIIR